LGSEADHFPFQPTIGFDINQGGYGKGGPSSRRVFFAFQQPTMKDYPEEKRMPLSIEVGQDNIGIYPRKTKGYPLLAYLSFLRGSLSRIQNLQGQTGKKYIGTRADSRDLLKKGF